MSNVNYKFRFLLLIWLIPFSCFAGDEWSNKTAQMQCGSALITVSAQCQAEPIFTEDNRCKNYQLEIKNGRDNKVFHLPYIPDDQKKLLEKQGYTFNNVVEPGDWAPFTMSCYDNESIVIGYQLGLTEEETVNGSLVSTIDAPFFDLSGQFITGRKLSELRKRELTGRNDYTFIDFISNP